METEQITTASGLKYEIIKMGNGEKPSATDKVEVHYHGTLEDGTVFDSSVERGETITFGLNQVIKGWTEGLQLMPIGSKFKFTIPPELAYGDRNMGSIPPNSTLVFEVELFDIQKPFLEWTYTFDENTIDLNKVKEIGWAANNSYGTTFVSYILAFDTADAIDTIFDSDKFVEAFVSGVSALTGMIIGMFVILFVLMKVDTVDDLEDLDLEDLEDLDLDEELKKLEEELNQADNGSEEEEE